MKTLNLDSLAKVERSLTLGGVDYPVDDMTVENFIETTKQAELLERDSKATFADQIEASISMIQRSVPTCPAEKLRRLSIEQLVTVSKFIRGELDEEKGEAASADESGDKKK